MTGGPDDGADLYPEGREPCLICGLVVSRDFDGPLAWHFRPRPAWEPAMWCPGSRQTLDAPT